MEQDLLQKNNTLLYNQSRRELIDSQRSTSSVGHKNWDIISKSDVVEAELYKAFFNAGRSIFDANTITNIPTLRFVGEEIYTSLIRHELSIRNLIVAKVDAVPIAKPAAVICGKKSRGRSSKAIKAPSKADVIRQANILQKARTDLIKLLNLIDDTNADDIDVTMLNEKCVEYVAIRLLTLAKYYTASYVKNKRELATCMASKYPTAESDLDDLRTAIKNADDEITELIVGFTKILSQYKSNTQISATCLQDCHKVIDQLKSIIDYDCEKLIMEKRRLIFTTKYDYILTPPQVKLYKSQQDVFDYITKINPKSYLVLWYSMFASGKTIEVLPICGYLMSNPQLKTKLIYSCPNSVVIWDVANKAYAAAIPFAIVVRNKVSGELEYKWSSFVDKKDPMDSTVLLLCDIFVARALLEQRQDLIRSQKMYMSQYTPTTNEFIPQVPDYIFIGDEMTINADSQAGFLAEPGFSLETEVYADILKIIPEKTIIMSATLPTYEQMPEFYDAVVSKHPGMEIKSFSASETKIGCALISRSGELYAPHIGCESREQVAAILSNIKPNPFVGRFYTFEVLYAMTKTWKDLGLPHVDLAEMFQDLTNANQTAIQQIAYQLLQTLVDESSDDVVKKACESLNSKYDEINLSKMLTRDFLTFSRGTLVFSTDPVQMAMQVYKSNFDNYLSSRTGRDIFQQVRFDAILNKYQSDVDAWQSSIDKINAKTSSGSNKTNRQTDKKERSGPCSWQIASNMQQQRPNWEFPESLQLGSIHHSVKNSYDNSGGSFGTVGPDDMPENSVVPTELLQMLASGIGVYSTKSRILDEVYLKAVIALVRSGVIRVLFADSTIAYGTNFPISVIVIMDNEILKIHSMKTVLQMLGRGGRPGTKSYESLIYAMSADNDLIHGVHQYLTNTLDEGERDEIRNIDRAFKTLWR